MALKVKFGTGKKNTGVAPVTGRTTSIDTVPLDRNTVKIKSAIQSSRKKSPNRSTVFKIGSPAEQRMLKEKSLILARPELLGIMDYFPLYEGPNTMSPAGELFDLRNVLRAADLENIRSVFNDIKTQQGYSSALSQYNSAIGSVYAEFTILKLVYLMRVFTEKATSFEAFQKLYSFPAEVDTRLIGSTFKDYLSNQMKFNPVLGVSDYFDYSTIPLLQLMAELSFSSALGSPELLDMNKRNLTAQNGLVVNTNYRGSISTSMSLRGGPKLTVPSVSALGGGLLPVREAKFCCNILSRDLTASLQLSRIRGDFSPNSELKEIIENYELENWLIKTSKETNTNIFKSISGWDRWSLARSSYKKFSKSRTPKFLYIDQIPTKWGITKSIINRPFLYPENESITLTKSTTKDRTFKSIKDKVDSSFNLSEGQLNFDEYKQITDDISKHTKSLGITYKILFRLLDRKTKDDEENYSGIAVLDNEQPFSPASIFVLCLDILNRRFIKNLDSYFYDEHTTETKRVTYVRGQAYLFIKDYPKQAKDIVKAYFKDYLKGFLTAAAVPSEDDETGKISDPENIEPITGNSVNLADKYTRVNGTLADIRNRLDTMDNVVGHRVRAANDELDIPEGINTGKILDNTVSILTDSDLRTNVCWYTNTVETYTEVGVDPVITERRRYWYSKLMAAEIIDCVLELIRKMINTVEEIESVDGDPVFPEVTNFRSPYGRAAANFTNEDYAAVDTEYWVPTTEKFLELFTRSSDQSLLYSSRDLDEFLEMIVDSFYSILKENFDDYTLKKMKFNVHGSYNISEGGASPTMDYSGTYWVVVSALNAVTTGGNAREGGRTSKPSESLNGKQFKDFSERAYKMVDKITTSSPTNMKNLSYSNSDIAPNAEDKLVDFLAYCKETFLSLWEEDQTLGAGFDMLEKYGERVEEYATTAISALSSDDAEVSGAQEYINGLSKAGNTGVDILENINPQQLSLKMVSLQRQMGVPDEGYLPAYAVLNDKILESIKILNQNISLVGTEGDNVRVVSVGLTAGLLQDFKLNERFSIVVNNVDLEYSDIVFKPKFYNFDPNLYVLPTDFNNINISSANSFKELVKLIEFTKIKFEINDGSKNNPVISLEESDDIKMANDKEIDLYSNHLISYLLECYYRIMVGLEFSEDTFLSSYESLGMDINQYANDLAGLISNVYNDASIVNDKPLSFNANNLIDNYAAAIDDKILTPGEFTDIDSELMSQFRNNLTSTLLSAENMRDNIMAAKLFDRVFLLLIDPDEFVIAHKGNTAREKTYTDPNVLEKYLNKGIIESAGTNDNGETIYKLAPRKKSEGRMAFNQFFVSIGRQVSSGNKQVDLST